MVDGSWGSESFGGGASPSRRRFRIWELENNIQCFVVGTCLTPGMVRQLKRRAGMSAGPGLQAGAVAQPPCSRDRLQTWNSSVPRWRRPDLELMKI